MTILEAKNNILSLLLERDSITLNEILETYPSNREIEVTTGIYLIALKALEESFFLNRIGTLNEWVLQKNLKKISQTVDLSGDYAVSFANILNRLSAANGLENSTVDSFSLSQDDFELALIFLAGLLESGGLMSQLNK